MLLSPPIRLLAIAPGTRTLGVAVLEGGSLIYYGVKNLPKTTLPNRLVQHGKAMVKNLLERFSPEVLVMEVPVRYLTDSPRRPIPARQNIRTRYPTALRSHHLVPFIRAIQKQARKQRISLASYTPQAILAFFASEGVRTKEDLAAAIARRYAELHHYLPRSRKRWEGRESYWMPMFVACALALVHADTRAARGKAV